LLNVNNRGNQQANKTIWKNVVSFMGGVLIPRFVPCWDASCLLLARRV